MKTLNINQNDGGQRLDKFLSKSVPLLPSSLMYKYIRSKRIKLNGRRCAFDTRLSDGDILELYINDEFFADGQKPYTYDFLRAGKAVNILFEDENILLLNKQPGLLSHPDETEYTDTAITRITRYLYEKGEYDPQKENSFVPSLANRIDRNTSGIVIAAKNAEALRILNEKIKNRELKKLYLCVCIGKFDRESGILKGYLEKDENKNLVTVTKHKTVPSKEITTAYKVLQYRNGLSLLEVELLTGRTHQIRAHFASIGHPLLGDGKYGKNADNKKFGGYKKQFLCSYKLTFDFQTDAGVLSYLNGQSFEIKDIWFRDDFHALTHS